MRFHPLARVCALVPWLLACPGILTTSPDVVESDLKRHLKQRYGEHFEVSQVGNQSNEGVGIVDRFGYTAHPVASPELTFRGRVSYDHAPPKYGDNYGCEATKVWLLPLIEQRLAARQMRASPANLVCADQGPPVPAGPPLDPTVWRWKPEVHSFTDAPLEDLTLDLQALSTELGIQIEPGFYVFPAWLEPHVSALPWRTGMASEVHNYTPWIRGVVTRQGTKNTPRHFTTIEQSVLEKLDHPAQVQVRQRFGKDPATATLEELTGSVLLDVRRVAATAWTEEQAKTYRQELRELVPGQVVDVRVLDPVPKGEAPVGPGWLCTFKCEREDLLVGPLGFEAR